ncbi:gustatory and pheromone receptor 32a-like [Sabethes cyaneus]|uniref:gustatory and pheromone receptor 32a-like n=1 Tax=Sabethes cyaneus TaxID=53552 RepID=UPI00237E2BBD|nr:gustatory and pheromone receptor 32a-like [Sabethes cyaneus]
MLPINQFYYLSKLFGLAPFPLDGNIASDGARFSAHRELLPACIAMLLYTSTLVSILWNSGIDSTISNTANWIQFIPNSYAYLFAIVFAIRKRAVISDILYTFDLYDERLHSQFGISHTDIKRKVKWVSLMACLVTLTSGGAVSGLNFMIGVNWDRIWTLFYWMAFCIPKFGLLLYTFQFAGSIMLLSNRTVLLQIGIDNYLNETNQQQLRKSSLSHSLCSQEPPSYGKHIHTVSIKVKPFYTISDTVDNIYQMVEHLQQLAVKINDSFGKQAVFSLLSAFICITVQLYYLLNQIRAGFVIPGAAVFCLAASSLLLLHGIEFYALFTNGDLARNHWRQLMNYLFVVKAKSSDENFRAKMDELIGFMSCNSPEFRAFGLFPIDLSVLTGMASSIATYLIVLVQFKMSEEDGQPFGTAEITRHYNPMIG